MNHTSSRTISALYHFWRNDRGLAFIESAFILPLFVLMVMGTFDIGQALILNQKVSAASHMAADLITRQGYVSEELIDDTVEAARLVIDPFDRQPFGLDIVSIEFDNNDNPQTVWRRTTNMPADNTLPDDADGLGFSGEGVVAVTAVYQYEPFATGVFTGTFTMTETAYLRGRRNSIIRMEE